MVIDKIRELSTVKARIEMLEKSIAVGLKKELARLPGRYGFGNVDEFISALMDSADRKPRRPTKTKHSKFRRKRAKITDATRAMVKKMVGAGNTGATIAKDLEISLPSVQNIKRDLGLVKGRKKSGSKPRIRAKKSKKAAFPKSASLPAPVPPT